MAKTLYFKTSDRNGNFKGAFYDFSFASFEKNINGGLGDLSVTVPRKFDDFGEGAQISEGYELRVFVVDKEAPDGRLIYSGEIEEIEAESSVTESVTINCVGYVFELALQILQTPATNNVTVRYRSYDPGAMIRDIILNRYRPTRSNPKINCSVSTVLDTGKSEGLDFYAAYCLDAIKEAKGLSNADWFYYIDETNTFYFKQFATTPKHLFTVGKDVLASGYTRSLKDVRNQFLFSNGQTAKDPEAILKMYTDTTSLTANGNRAELKRDDRYKKSTGSSDELAARYLTANKDALNTVKLRIVDSNFAGGYDIESIQVGDTCKVLNIKPNNALTGNMVITNITYGVDYCDIVIADVNKYVARELENLRATQQEMQFNDQLPTSYTT